MSCVTNVLLCGIRDDAESAPLLELQNWLQTSLAREPQGVGWLSSLTNEDVGEKWGGTKYPECEIWAGAFNHLNVSRMIEKVGSIEWDDKPLVQLMIQGNDDYSFAVWMFQEGVLTCVLPAIHGGLM